MEFRKFLLNENKAYFSQKISDILSALQDLNDNAENLGTRHLVSNAELIVNQIRRILHTDWPQSEQNNLLVLQKCGVAIVKAIEEKDELIPILKSCQTELQQIGNETPTNKLVQPEEKR